VHHPNATQLVEDLASQFKVIADVRPPDIVRLGLSPLTTRFTDVWDGIERLSQLINR
jgi:kynureninase